MSAKKFGLSNIIKPLLNVLFGSCQYILPILIKNSRLLVKPNNHLSTKPKLATFFGIGTISLLLFSFNLSNHMFMQRFGAIAVFYYEHWTIYTFFYFFKKVNFLPRKLVFLVVGYLKTMNPGSSALFMFKLICKN